MDKPWRSTRIWPAEIKMNWWGRGRVVKIGWWLPRREVAGDVCLSWLRSTQGCRADNDDNDDVLPSLIIQMYQTFRLFAPVDLLNIVIIYSITSCIIERQDWYVYKGWKLFMARKILHSAKHVRVITPLSTEYGRQVKFSRLISTHRQGGIQSLRTNRRRWVKSDSLYINTNTFLILTKVAINAGNVPHVLVDIIQGTKN